MTEQHKPTGRYTQKIELSLKQEIIFTRDIFAPENQSIKELIPTGAEVFALIDSGLMETNPELLKHLTQYLQINNYKGPVENLIAVPGGEQIKNNPEEIKKIIKCIENNGLNRHSYLIAIGGGAVLDAVGFAASIVHRGIRHIRIPSTVLSQNDSGMGVKNGINHLGHKNFLGAFCPPEGVIVDYHLLNTLPDRYYRAGISEAFKVAIIKDSDFLVWLTENAHKASRRCQAEMEQLVQRCALLHLNHIASSGDPFEKESARPLDFGHWSAHHLEEITHNDLNHGEAVAIGICLDLQIAAYLKLISEDDAELVTEALQKCGLPIWHDALLLKKNSILLLMSGLESFQKHIGGSLTLVMPQGFGNETEIHFLSEEILAIALKKMESIVKKVGGEQCLLEMISR
ncbi:3-dehydroquinate synthase [bacterium]|nr:3-dehydroquinate synthase [bacterium]